jgi:hypothetical protein
MIIGIWGMIDQAIADELGVSVEVYAETIDKFDDPEFEYIIETMMSITATNEEKQKAKELFNTKL